MVQFPKLVTPAILNKRSGWFSASTTSLFSPVNNSSLTFFRASFGLIMLWECWRYFKNGWIARYWIEPDFFFSYGGFGWLRPLPGMGMYLLFGLLAILAVGIMLGFYYRISALFFFVVFTYIFLLDKANYLNHFYLISLISFLLIFLPLHQGPSIDSAKNPSMRREQAPAWVLWLLQFQVGIAYFYGGIAKLNRDWLTGEPMRLWLAERTDFPLFGQFFVEEWAVAFFSYGGLLFDLLIVPFLLWKRTRVFAFLTAVLFHLMNDQLFSIGIFPWFMIFATTLFFPPDWPTRLFTWENAQTKGQATGRPMRSEGKKVFQFSQHATVTLLAVYVLIQLVIPLRHYLIPGNPSWSEEGHSFSWHMKLRDKAGSAQFFVTNSATGEQVDINLEDYLSARQQRKMSVRPDMILQFSHYLSEQPLFEEQGALIVQADVWTSLNGRSLQQLIDPTVNLAEQKNSLWRDEWILPLEE